MDREAYLRILPQCDLNCLDCDSNNLCKSCKPGYKVLNGTCILDRNCYDTNCAKCSSIEINSCTLCNMGYNLDSISRLCNLPIYKCSDNPISNCEKCSSTDNDICEICKKKYVLKAGQCKPMCYQVTCLSCLDSDYAVCETCVDNNLFKIFFIKKFLVLTSTYSQMSYKNILLLNEI